MSTTPDDADDQPPSESTSLSAEISRKAARLLGATARPGTNPFDAHIGRVLCGRYRIDSVIGAGGFGVVFRATHLAVSQPVALKLMLGEHVSNASQVARFEREAMSVSRLRAPNTIRVFDFGRDEHGNLFIVMELLAGRPLSSVLAEAGALSPRRVAAIGVQIAKSLAEAHEAGIVHRDLKPDNIFLADLPGEEDYVKVLDFGIAKLVGEQDAGQNELTRQGAIIGTPTYMSPEQARGAPVDAKSDLYSFGVVLFRMLAGRPPFEAPSLITLAFMHNDEAPPDLAALGRPEDPIPAELVALVGQLLEKDPAARPASARALINALLAVPHTVPTAPTPSVAPPRADPEAPTVELGPKTVELDMSAPPSAPKGIDPALVERATTKLAEHLGPIARIVAKKALPRARDGQELVRLMAEQLEPAEREAYLASLGVPKR